MDALLRGRGKNENPGSGRVSGQGAVTIGQALFLFSLSLSFFPLSFHLPCIHSSFHPFVPPFLFLPSLLLPLSLVLSLSSSLSWATNTPVCPWKTVS